MTKWPKNFAFALCLGLTACGAPYGLKQTAEAMTPSEIPLTAPLNLAKPAIIETNYLSEREPSCNESCIRLLFNGQAKSVISGFAVTPPASSSNWLGKGPDSPDKLANIQVRVYHIEHRLSCPPAEFSDSDDFNRPSSKSDIRSKPVREIVAVNIASGNCLIGVSAYLSDATSILIFSDSHWTDNDAHQNIRAKTLTVYNSTAIGAAPLYRHTVTNLNYYPWPLSSSLNYIGYQGANLRSEKRLWPDIVASDLRFGVTDLPTASQAYVRGGTH
jgi:hypothetical protein